MVDASSPADALPLDGEISIQRIAELRDLIWAHLQTNKVLHFDVSNISAIDIAGLQLLCSAHRTAQRLGGDAVIVQRMPYALQQIIKDAGFKRHRGCTLDKNHSCLWTLGESS